MTTTYILDNLTDDDIRLIGSIAKVSKTRSGTYRTKMTEGQCSRLYIRLYCSDHEDSDIFRRVKTLLHCDGLCGRNGYIRRDV